MTFTGITGKAFNQIRTIAKQFQKKNPKMVYADAMEKAVGGFREIHGSGVISEETSVKEWNQVYAQFMVENGLSVEE